MNPISRVAIFSYLANGSLDRQQTGSFECHFTYLSNQYCEKRTAMTDIHNQLSRKEHEIIRDLLDHFFTMSGVRCYLFGSAAKGIMRPSSDIDLLIISDRDLRASVSLFREALEDTNITRNVDVVWYKDAPQSLLHNAVNKGVLIWKN